MKVYKILLIIFLLIQAKQIFAGSSIKISKDWFYINGERMLIKGIGYSNCKPHEQPNTKHINLLQEKEEFRVIREAGFNTIRTWKPLSIEELKLAEEAGLYVIQGVWIEYGENYTDPEKIKQITEILTPMVRESSQAHNILTYLMGNEPLPSQVFSVGRIKTDKLFIDLRKAIRAIQSNSYVGLSNWVQCDFLDDTMWDMLALNIYIYNPESVSHAMGYRGYVDWLKRVRAFKRPLVITECGFSVSKSGVGHKGYGGNTDEEQKNGVLYMYKQAFNGGATGVCVFEFIDEWWKNFNHGSDKDIHENTDPEEWFGICYYDDKGEKLTKRPVYEALKEFNQAVCVTPVEYSKVSKSFPVEVYAEDTIVEVSVKPGDSDKWTNLKRKSSHWFQGDLNVKNMPDGHTVLHISARTKDNVQYTCNKVLYIDNKKSLNVPYAVKILLDKDIYYTASKMTTVRLRFEVRDAKGKLVPKQPVTVAIYEPVLNQKLVLDLTTDDYGIATHIYNINEEGILTVSAGVQAFPDDTSETDKKLLIKNGDCKHIQIYYEKRK